MSNLLVAVKSSFADMRAGKHDRIRGTWGSEFRGKAHLKFFLGRETQELNGVVRSLVPSDENSYIAKADEIIIDAPDDPQGDVKKARAMCGFISNKVIAHVLLVDVNSVVDVKAALATPYEGFDYVGTFDNWGDIGPRTFLRASGEMQIVDRCFDFAKGEHGVFLSRRAALEVADAPPQPRLYVAGSNWDLWIGQVIGPLVGGESFLTMPVDPVARKA
jgi:hypothetical protein